MRGSRSKRQLLLHAIRRRSVYLCLLIVGVLLAVHMLPSVPSELPESIWLRRRFIGCSSKALPWFSSIATTDCQLFQGSGATEEDKNAMVKAQPPVYVLSLRRSQRVATYKLLRRERVQYQTMTAVDGLQELPADEVELYAGTKTKADLWRTWNGSHVDLQHAPADAITRRMIFASKLGFIRVMHRVAAQQGSTYAVFLEDDALPERGFKQKLVHLLCDLVWQHHVPIELVTLYWTYRHNVVSNSKVSSTARKLCGGSLSAGYLVSKRFATQFIRSLAYQSDLPKDLIVSRACVFGKLSHTFAADPLLISRDVGQSTIRIHSRLQS